ncbi:MAG TPA: YbaB/EbfC family nucleoid-associated protein [Thermomonospora sp.]|nr:YbaB/EbfC family nucleoid-associated protein [Thermomonospora sp.]
MLDFDPNSFRLEDLDKLSAQADQAMRRLAESAEALTEVVGEGEAADGLVRAVVDGGGALRSVDLNPRAMRMGSEELGRAVTVAVTAAQADAQRRVQELLTAAMGEHEAPTRLDSEALRRQFGQFGEMFSRSLGEEYDGLQAIRRNLP